MQKRLHLRVYKELRAPIERCAKIVDESIFKNFNWQFYGFQWGQAFQHQCCEQTTIKRPV